jgi:N-acetyl sugar amidotransferase
VKNHYCMCTRCVMDTTAEEIEFDENGMCSFCYYFDKYVQPILERTKLKEGERTLHRIVETVKKIRKNRSFDSILGLSGGLDSSYLAYLAVELGLHPLAVHVDMGWNSQISEENIVRVVSKLNLELETVTVDFGEMRDLQIAFYKASVKNCEIPQDHAFLAALYRAAARHGIRYILRGGNLATESILPKSWGYNTGDMRHLLAIHRRFGTRKLYQYPTLGFWQRYLYYPFIRGIKDVRLLNYVPYNRDKAKRYLGQEFGWQDYGAKHFESVLTRFFQGYYLPTKFNIDKRKAHLSSLILSGQITREEALEELEKPAYTSKQLQAQWRLLDASQCVHYHHSPPTV